MNTPDRIRVLVFVRYYIPSYKSGGPVRSVANLVDHLSDRFDFWIVCRDRDSFDAAPFPGVNVNETNSVGNAQVFYASPDYLTLWTVKPLVNDRDCDLMYLNSFFDYSFTLLPLLARRFRLTPRKPVVIAPRGEFSQGAMAIRKTKKTIFLAVVKLLRVYHGLTWQASSEHEANDIRRVMGTVAKRIVVAPNLASAHDTTGANTEPPSRPGQPLRIVFLSRVSPKKNLDFALRVLAKAQRPVVFHVYGVVDDDGYWSACRSLVARLPEHVAFAYKGVVDRSRVFDVLSSYDLLFLPTKGENFGHVIQEALSAGTPPLISDLTPWLGLDDLGVGWVRKLGDPEGFLRVIERAAQESEKLRSDRRIRAISYGRKRSSDPLVLAANVDLFFGVLGKE